MDTFTQEIKYNATRINIGRARDHVAALLADRVGAAHLADVRLLTSELVTNAVLYGDGTDFTVTVHADAGTARVAVANTGDGRRTPDDAASTFDNLDAEGGRGIALLRALAADYGYTVHDTRVTVWFDMPTTPAAAVLVAA